MTSTAVISEDGLYRYELTRCWATDDEPVVCWIMLNPSTADADVDDNTVTNCIRFSKRWGAGGLVVVNLFAYRATYPSVLASCPDPVGPDNDPAIMAAAARASLVVAAWGTCGKLHNRAARVTQMLAGDGLPLFCLERTKDGHPRHPRAVSADRDPIVYR